MIAYKNIEAAISLYNTNTNALTPFLRTSVPRTAQPEKHNCDVKRKK
jgi:hypothetical protein